MPATVSVPSIYVNPAFEKATHDWCEDEAGDHPMCAMPKKRKKTPIRTASVEVSELNSVVPWAATAPTINAEMRPVAVSGPTSNNT